MRSHVQSVLAAVCVGALAGLIGCSAGDGSIGAPTSGHPQGAGNHNPGTGSGSGSDNGTGSGNGNGATPPPSGTTPPPSGTNPTPDPGTPPPADASTISADETWAAGKTIAGNVVIAAGVTVTIAPSASITIADGKSITVQGTLKGTSPAASHAKLTGTAWTGVVVAKGGTLALTSVDIDNATTAIDTQAGNVAATFDSSIINAATTPFKVDAGGKLSMTRSNVVGSKGMSSVGGSFTASHLDYDSNGSEGIAMVDPSAVFSADDSRFHGTSNSGGDMIVSNNAKTLHLSHSEIAKCHCAFHINNVTNMDVSFMSLHDDSYGFMQYGSDPATGTRTVSDSNFVTLAGIGFDEAGINGPITLSNVYFNAVTGGNLHLIDKEITVKTPAAAAVAGVGPRP
jgi:hypothetical protein